MAPNTNNQARQPNQRGNRPESTSSDSNQRSSRDFFWSHISCGYKGKNEVCRLIAIGEATILAPCHVVKFL